MGFTMWGLGFNKRIGFDLFDWFVGPKAPQPAAGEPTLDVVRVLLRASVRASAWASIKLVGDENPYEDDFLSVLFFL